MDAETGEPLTGADGSPVAATAEFAPEAAEGTQTVELSFDSTGYGGHRLVAFERLLDAEGTVLAAHEDIEDEGQSVTACEIGTELVDSADGDHMVENGTVSVVDTVEYKGLVAGETYTAHGTIMDKATGMPLEDAEGNPVTAAAEFTAESSEGTVEVAFEFDASRLEEGAALVRSRRCSTRAGTSPRCTRTSRTKADGRRGQPGRPPRRRRRPMPRLGPTRPPGSIRSSRAPSRCWWSHPSAARPSLSAPA